MTLLPLSLFFSIYLPKRHNKALKKESKEQAGDECEKSSIEPNPFKFINNIYLRHLLFVFYACDKLFAMALNNNTQQYGEMAKFSSAMLHTA